MLGKVEKIYIKTIYPAKQSLLILACSVKHIVPLTVRCDIFKYVKAEFVHENPLQLLALLFIQDNLYVWFFIKESKKHKSWLENVMMLSPSALNQAGRLLPDRDVLMLMYLHMRPGICCYRQLARSGLS